MPSFRHRTIVAYAAFVDVSLGRHDDYSLAIGHTKESGVVVLDALRWWSPPFDPKEVTAEASKLMKKYGVLTAKADRVGGEYATSLFRANGIDLSQSAETKSDLYLTTLGKVNSGQVELLDVPKLLRQLRGLERRAMRGGREAVDHRRGAYDDVANVAAGLIATAATQVHDEDFFGFSNEWYGGGQFEDRYPMSEFAERSTLMDAFGGRRERRIDVKDSDGVIRDSVVIVDGDAHSDETYLGDARSDSERFLGIRRRKGRLA